MKNLRIGMIGYGFMGRAHSNAYRKVGNFFDLEHECVLQVACARNEANIKAFAAKWGYASIETDWRRAVERDDVDVVDISLPQHLHHEVAIAAAKAGKHLFCEKPMALSLSDAEAMLAAAEAAKVVHYVNHNYRRTPAVRLARQFSGETSASPSPDPVGKDDPNAPET